MTLMITSQSRLLMIELMPPSKSERSFRMKLRLIFRLHGYTNELCRTVTENFAIFSTCHIAIELRDVDFCKES